MDFGRKLLGDRGWDPFLENPASLWLLHWHLLKPTCEAAAWYYIFYQFRKREFTSNDLFSELQEYTQGLGKKIAESSLKKNVSCLLRMYVEQGDPKQLNEDSIDSPFTSLNLIQNTGDAKHYLFKVGEKITLPPEIIVAACLEFAETRGTQRTISIATLAYEFGSPGLAFKLPESAIYDAIEAVANSSDSLTLKRFLEEVSVESDVLPTLTLDQLYDYFIEAAGMGLASRPNLQRWVEIQDLIADANHLNADYVRTLKTIGILNLVTVTG